MEREISSKDVTGDVRALLLNYGLPTAAMIAAIGVEHPLKTFIWVAGLIWMGGVCIANARRCGRTHCYFTGPFFLFMTIPVLLHGYQVVYLGPEGWKWLGIAIGAGGGGIWCFSEKLLGKYWT